MYDSVNNKIFAILLIKHANFPPSIDFRISSSMHRKLTTEAQRIEQEELDIRCLQLLRAVIHNEERRLPEDWEENPTEHKK